MTKSTITRKDLDPVMIIKRGHEGKGDVIVVEYQGEIYAAGEYTQLQSYEKILRQVQRDQDKND